MTGQRSMRAHIQHVAMRPDRNEVHFAGRVAALPDVFDAQSCIRKRTQPRVGKLLVGITAPKRACERRMVDGRVYGK